MVEIMNSPKGVKSGVPEGVSMSCPTCGTRHDLRKMTVGEQTCQMCQMCEQGLHDDHRLSVK